MTGRAGGGYFVRGDCREFEPELSAWIDGELDGDEAARIASHVGSCGPCGRDAARLRAVSRALHDWERAETHAVATPLFRRRVLARLGETGETGAEPGGRDDTEVLPAEPAEVATTPWRGLAAAAALLVGAAAWAIATSGDGGESNPRRSGGGGEVALAVEPLDLGSLERDVARLRAESELLEAGAPVDRSSGAGTRDDAAWEPVLATRGGDAPVPVSARFGSPPERFFPEWEEHGDVRILRDAFDELERFRRDVRELALRTDVRRLTERALTAGPSPGAGTDVPNRPTSDAPESGGTALGRWFAGLRLGDEPAARVGDVSAWALTRDGGVSRPGGGALLTAEDALPLRVLRAGDPLRAGSADDAHFAGSVSLENRDRRGRSVLLLAGDVLAGGRRDRVAAEDVLLEPGQRRSVAVRTTGRAHRRSRSTFSRSDGVAPLRVRALLAADAPQSAIDRATAECLPWLGSAGGRGSLDDLFENDQLISRADRYVDDLSRGLDDEGVVGFVLCARGDVLGVEVFGDHATFSAASDRVLRSFVLEVLARGSASGSAATRDDVLAVLAAARDAARGAQGESGEGGTVAFATPDDATESVLGHALVESGRVHHAVVLTDAALVGTGLVGRRIASVAAGDRAPPGTSDPAEPTGEDGDSGPRTGDTGTGSGGIHGDDR